MNRFKYFAVILFCISIIAFISGECSPDIQLSLFGIDDMALAVGASSLIGGIGSMIGSSNANSTQKEIAADNRQWQSDENQKNRDWQSEQNLLSQNWQEKMWNAQNSYNTPSALMERNRAAGLNPFLLGSNTPASVGAAQSAGTPAKGSLSMVGSPSMPNIQPVNYGAPFSSLASTLLTAKGVDANAANQKAQSVKSIVEAATDAFKSMGYKGFNSVLRYAAPFLGSSSPEGSFVEREAYYKLQEMQLNNAQNQLALSLSTKFSEDQIRTGLEKANYEISEIVGRLNTMRISNDVALKKLANDTLVSVAEAFKLRKEGDKYQADAKTVNAIRDYVVKSVRANADIGVMSSRLMSDKLPFEEALIPGRYQKEGNQLDLTGSKEAIFLDYVTDQVGDVFHFGMGSYNTKSSGVVRYGQLPFVEAQWDTPNPYGTTTHYRQRK